MKKRNNSRYVVGGILLVGLLGSAYWLGRYHADHPKSSSFVSPLTSVLENSDNQEETDREVQEQLLEEQRVETQDKEEKLSSEQVTSSDRTPNPLTSIKYHVYSQGRWGYKFRCPTFLSPKESSTNSDGNVFESKDGVKLLTYGGWNVLGESIGDLYRKNLSDVQQVTYKRLFEKQKSYVKSGYTKDGRVFYMKEAIIGKSDEEIIVTLILYYPKVYNHQIDSVIQAIFPSFPH